MQIVPQKVAVLIAVWEADTVGVVSTNVKASVNMTVTMTETGTLPGKSALLCWYAHRRVPTAVTCHHVASGQSSCCAWQHTCKMSSWPALIAQWQRVPDTLTWKCQVKETFTVQALTMSGYLCWRALTKPYVWAAYHDYPGKVSVIIPVSNALMPHTTVSW